MSYRNNKIIAIIPARGGSKGIPRKNIINLCGKPLIAWTIEQVKGSKYIDEVYVSTDDLEIKKVSQQYGAKIINRPKELASDSASTESALLHASEYLNHGYDIMCLFQCTSPMRYSYQIDEAIEQLFRENADSLLSGYRNDVFFWDMKGNSINYDYKKRPRRQDKEWEFVENGSFYIFKKEVLLKYKNRLGGKISLYYMPKWMSFEIDEPFDLELIRFLMENKFLKNIDNKVIQEKVEKIKLVIFDVDGVFTDGSVYVNEQGREMLKFSRIDGKGIELLREKGINVAVISSEDSKIVENRMKKLKITDVFLGIKNKLEIYDSLKKKYDLTDENICFCGDDIQDIPVLKKVGLSCCPKNAVDEVKSICDYVSTKSGGHGFVRDVARLILK